MAARTRRGTKENPWTENVRERIKVAMLIKHLQDHVDGLRPLMASQLKAVEILLDRALPRLTATELTGSIEIPNVVRAPTVAADSPDWSSTYRPTPAVTNTKLN